MHKLGQEEEGKFHFAFGPFLYTFGVLIYSSSLFLALFSFHRLTSNDVSIFLVVVIYTLDTIFPMFYMCSLVYPLGYSGSIAANFRANQDFFLW